MAQDAVHDAERLKELQALPLERKVMITQTRIIEWYQHYNGQVCVSFSGGKDSTVLLHIARGIYPDIPAVFSNTGLEYPEIQRFVRSFDNVDIVAPEMRFDQVLSTYGYPLIGKEVAEAIYYARRIHREREQRSNSDKRREEQAHDTDRTMGRKRGELCGTRNNKLEENGTGGAEPSDTASPSEVVGDAHNGREPQQTEKNRGRPSSTGKWGDYHRRSLNPDKSNAEDIDRFFNKPATTEWSDWRRGCL